MKIVKIVISDLDGTLLNDAQKIDYENLKTIEYLKSLEIVIVIATGRNIFSLNKVLNPDFPVDYIVFSSGAGVYDWKKKEVIYRKLLNKKLSIRAAKILNEAVVDFAIHDVIPDNHFFKYILNASNSDFLRRNKTYENYCTQISDLNQIGESTQLLAIFNREEDFFNTSKNLYANVSGIKIIRATSPIDGKSFWLEIFPKSVNKGLTSQWLCNKLGIKQENTFGIGNDFNDIDLLDWTNVSFIVSNAPLELKKLYNVTKSNNECGFSVAIDQVLNFLT